jgi:Zn-dependent protease with chaperone function
MTQSKFKRLIDQLETYARHRPRAYRVHVALFAFLGYIYAIVLLAGLVGLSSGIFSWLLSRHDASRPGIWIFVIFSVIAIAFLLLRVERLEARGYLLQRRDAPELFKLLNELSEQLRAPRIHRVYLTGDFNASMIQSPRFGMFGWSENMLEVGVPLLKSLSVEQFRAVIAHEIGHLSAGHSRFCSWIYCIRQTWSQVLESLRRTDSPTNFLLVPFLSWYSPFFNAYSFVLARSNEYEADRAAAHVAGARLFAESLIRIRLQSQLLNQRFWPVFYRRANDDPNPPDSCFDAMFEILREGPSRADAERWFEEALADRTTTDDTHPSLASRLAAMGFVGVSAGPLDPSRPPMELPDLGIGQTADVLLGSAAPTYIARLDADWRWRILPIWRRRHVEAQKAFAVLDDLDDRAMNGQITDEEVWQRVALTAEYQGRDAAAPLLEDILDVQPNEPRALFALGLLKLDQDDVTGIRLVEKAMSREPSMTVTGCMAIYYCLRRVGKDQSAVTYRQRADRIKYPEEQESIRRPSRRPVMFPGRLPEPSPARLHPDDIVQ